jgi:UDP-glucose 4-epimerase
MAGVNGERRVLVTGLSSQLGGRLALALERDPRVEAIVGVDIADPRFELQRTEFVRIDLARRPLERIIAAAAIDTVLDTRLLADPLTAPLARIHDVDVAGTGELLAACAGPDSPVRRLVFKSSANYYGWEAGQPAFLSEEMARRHPARTELEREIARAEGAVRDFAARHPSTRVSVLRVADEVGAEGRTSLRALLSLPAVPAVLGFDPRFQVVHFDDVVAALAHAATADLEGAYNLAADGVLVLSEIASLLGKPLLPVLPPWGMGFAAEQLRRLGLRVPVEMVRQLRYGRGLENRRLKATGFSYAYTTREAILRMRSEQRQRPLLGPGEAPYRYDPELEQFLRRSPSVRSARARRPDPVAAGRLHGLGAGELIDLIPSLEPEALALLRDYERAHEGREEVLDALDTALEHRMAPPSG